MGIFFLKRLKQTECDIYAFGICVLCFALLVFAILYAEVSSINLEIRFKTEEPVNYYSWSNPRNISIDYGWRNIENTSLHVAVYSAYFIEDVVQIVALKGQPNRTIFCFIQFNNSDGTLAGIQTTVDVDIVPEHHRTWYKTVIISCRYNFTNEMRIPLYVGLSYNESDIPYLYWRVHAPSARQNMFTICVRPFMNGYNSEKAIIAWVEMTRILGADQFVFYNYRTGRNAAELLRYYEKQGIVTLLSWNLPIGPRQIWQAGQVASIYDCFFRNYNKSQYVIPMDVDEAIIPKKHKNWAEMIKSFNETESTNFIFTNTFYPLQWKNPEVPNDIKQDLKWLNYNLTFLTYFRHLKSKYPDKDRAKTISNPRIVKYAGIHLSVLKQGKDIVVHPSIGALQHYRHWHMYGNYKQSLVNMRMLFYKNELIKKFDEQLKRYQKQKLNKST